MRTQQTNVHAARTLSRGKLRIGNGTAMNFLRQERETLDQLFPGLDAALAAIPLMRMEQEGNPSIPVFRDHGGPGLLIPKSLGGRGASPLDAARVQRAIASRAPSLAVATTMHHFTLATLIEMNETAPGPEDEVLAAVAREKLYVASDFAEGRTGVSIQTSALAMRRGPDGVILRGGKKPCSLSRSMDLFTASTPALDGMDAGLAVVIVPADHPGIERRRFWNTPILAGAESDEVFLNDVCVPEADFLPMGGPGRPNPLRDRGFLWFELLIAASHVGTASAMVERVLVSGRGGTSERVRLAADLEGAMASLEGIARAFVAGERGNRELARMILVRYSVQAAIERATSLAVELLGGMAFIQAPDVAYLLAASRALSLHPPPRIASGDRVDAYLLGADLVLD